MIRRSKPTIASGSPVRSSAKASARRSIARESWLETVVIAGAISASESATAGTAVASVRVSRSEARATA